jgi:hypothetical protein
MTAPQLEVLLKIYNTETDKQFTGYEAQDLIDMDLLTPDRFITDKGKALVEGILNYIDSPITVKTKRFPPAHEMTLEQFKERQKETLKFWEKYVSYNNEFIEKFFKDKPSPSDPTIETQVKKLEEINKLKPRYILRKDVPFINAGLGLYLGNDGLYSDPDFPRLTKVISFNHTAREAAIDELIGGGWIEEIKPREFCIVMSPGRANFAFENSHLAAYEAEQRSNAEIIKVREVID